MKSKNFDTLTVKKLIVGNPKGQHIQIGKESVEIHDKSGVSRLKMAIEGNGSPYLQFADSNGVARVTIHVTSEGPHILLHNSTGQTAFAIQALNDNRVAINEPDEQGRMGSWLRAEIHRQAENLSTERETALQ